MHNSPTPADDAFRNYLRYLTEDLAAWKALLHPEAQIVFPYAASLGMSEVVDGRDAVVAYIGGALARMKNLRISRLVTYAMASPNMVVGEFHADAIVGDPARAYSQDYIGILELKDGLVYRYKEYWDPVRIKAVMDVSQHGSTGGAA
jgi:ketosteroid isomerase-like protein